VSFWIILGEPLLSRTSNYLGQVKNKEEEEERKVLLGCKHYPKEGAPWK
jgi:hypothetical protein